MKIAPRNVRLGSCMTVRFCDFEDWVVEFSPVGNHLQEDAPFNGLMFETFGEELDYVRSVALDPDCKRAVWTLVECFGSAEWIVEGFHVVNRLGYFVTVVPYVENVYYEIKIGDSQR